jgi:hypothetical protein
MTTTSSSQQQKIQRLYRDCIKNQRVLEKRSALKADDDWKDEDEDEEVLEEDVYIDSNVEVTKAVDNYSDLNLLDIDDKKPTQIINNDIPPLNIIDQENEQNNKITGDLLDLLGDMSQPTIKTESNR